MPVQCSAGGGTSACSALSRESVPAVTAAVVTTAVVAAADAAQPMAQEVESAALAQPIKHVPHVGLEDIMAITPAAAPPALVPTAMTSAIVQAAVWRSVRCGTVCQWKTEHRHTHAASVGRWIIGRTGVAATASTQENAKRNRIVPVERERVGFEQPKAFK